MLVDYDEDAGVVTNFSCVLADWGTAQVWTRNHFFGGTPVYAGPHTFEPHNKDLFSFGRLALELFLSTQGLKSKTIL